MPVYKRKRNIVKATRAGRARKRQNFKSKRSYVRKGTTIRTIPRIATSRKTGMTACATAYMKAIYDPFGTFITNPCIPDAVAIPSQKFTLRQRGEMATDTAGDAAILLNPYGITNTSARVTVVHSNGLGSLDLDAFTPALELAKGTPTMNSAAWNSPYGDAQDLANKHRVVGAGIKISYSGIWELLSGNVQVFHHSMNTRNYFLTVKDVRPGKALTNFEETGYGSLSHNTAVECAYHPIDIDDYDYQNGPEASGTGNFPGYVLAIIITGAPVAATFTWEVIAHYEAVGPDMHSSEASKSDPKFSAINNLPKKQTVNMPGSSVFSTMWGYLSTQASKSIRFP